MTGHRWVSITISSKTRSPYSAAFTWAWCQRCGLVKLNNPATERAKCGGDA